MYLHVHYSITRKLWGRPEHAGKCKLDRSKAADALGKGESKIVHHYSILEQVIYSAFMLHTYIYALGISIYSALTLGYTLEVVPYVC